MAFSFAVAALIEGRVDAAWARWVRPWTVAAWSFLTLGIALGSWWAYYELGWGGWWFWDPVENASFMPWLVGTALVHSLMVTEKRGAFRGWTALLALMAFSLSLLGTFLVRSGVLVSVHAFAVNPQRGIYVLALLGAFTGAGLALYAWRVPRLAGGGGFGLLSRDTALLVMNVILVVAAGAVLLGTLYPLFYTAGAGSAVDRTAVFQPGIHPGDGPAFPADRPRPEHPLAPRGLAGTVAPRPGAAGRGDRTVDRGGGAALE